MKSAGFFLIRWPDEGVDTGALLLLGGNLSEDAEKLNLYLDLVPKSCRMFKNSRIFYSKMFCLL